MIQSDDTIFAPASGVGRAGVCVIRISGPQTRFAIETICGSVPEARRMSLRTMRDPENGMILDHGLVVFFNQSASFTGEDVGEFHIHGSLAIKKALLRVLGSFENCRSAERGEFTRRAFLNGRMDLAQAEGLMDLIDSETEQQRLQAMMQMDGVLSKFVGQWRETLLDALAVVESSLDFSDEEDVDDAIDERILVSLLSLQETFRECLKNRTGQRMREGFTVVLAGEPNAGKSSLLNVLANREAAIVSHIAGTTRDIIEVPCDLDGYPVTFIDTAGLRHTEDDIEREGIRRTYKKISDADLVLWLVPPDGTWPEKISGIPEETQIIVRTKQDLMTDELDSIKQSDISLSCITGDGIDSLMELIRIRIENLCSIQEISLTRERHREVIETALKYITQAIFLLQSDDSLEFVAEEIRLASRVLGSLTGAIGVEDVLDRIFSSFCIGK